MTFYNKWFCLFIDMRTRVVGSSKLSILSLTSICYISNSAYMVNISKSREMRNLTEGKIHLEVERWTVKTTINGNIWRNICVDENERNSWKLHRNTGDSSCFFQWIKQNYQRTDCKLFCLSVCIKYMWIHVLLWNPFQL